MAQGIDGTTSVLSPRRGLSSSSLSPPTAPALLDVQVPRARRRRLLRQQRAARSRKPDRDIRHPVEWSDHHSLDGKRQCRKQWQFGDPGRMSGLPSDLSDDRYCSMEWMFEEKEEP